MRAPETEQGEREIGLQPERLGAELVVHDVARVEVLQRGERVECPAIDECEGEGVVSEGGMGV